MKAFDSINQKIDALFLKIGIITRQKPPGAFETDMPIFIQEFLITYGAGITLERALSLTLSTQCKDIELLSELSEACTTIESLNRFAIKQDNKEIWRFVRLINQFHLTGAISTVNALEKFHDELWNHRLVKARKKSEQVSLQLTFLLMLSLISVIIVVLAPIMMILN